MNKPFRCALIFVIPALARAVYAPIPEQEQGKAVVYRLGASVYYDSNIFGSAHNPVDSMVYSLSGGLSFNSTLSDQTFASASYGINNDHEADRPGKKDLTSHNFGARFAQEFSPVSNLDLSGEYDISKNPESLLSGTVLNATGSNKFADQSNKRAEFDGRFTTAAGQKLGAVFKYRFIDLKYDNADLGTDLDHAEHLAGLELAYALLPETKLVGEYRYQKIDYDTGGSLKNKDSNFLMAGADYNPGKQTQISGRLGFEHRHRNSGGDTTVPYAEFSSRYNYAPGSFLAAGYVYTLEEPSDTVNYTDSKVNRFFVNAQHRLSGALTASASVTYEPAQLQGVPTHRDDDETTTRFGLGLSWQPDKNWTVAATYDLDDINSDVDLRNQHRERFGVAARVSF